MGFFSHFFHSYDSTAVVVSTDCLTFFYVYSLYFLIIGTYTAAIFSFHMFCPGKLIVRHTISKNFNPWCLLSLEIHSFCLGLTLWRCCNLELFIYIEIQYPVLKISPIVLNGSYFYVWFIALGVCLKTVSALEY